LEGVVVIKPEAVDLTDARWVEDAMTTEKKEEVEEGSDIVETKRSFETSCSPTNQVPPDVHTLNPFPQMDPFASHPHLQFDTVPPHYASNPTIITSTYPQHFYPSLPGSHV